MYLKNYHFPLLIFGLFMLISCSESSTDVDPEPEQMPEFSFQISIVDRVSKIDLNFGLDTDSNLSNEQAPPEPPDSALNAYFEREQSMWITDYRNPSENEFVWTLIFQKGLFEPLLINWEMLSESNMDGKVILESDLLQEEIDMKKVNSIEISPQDKGTLILRYLVDQSK